MLFGVVLARTAYEWQGNGRFVILIGGVILGTALVAFLISAG